MGSRSGAVTRMRWRTAAVLVVIVSTCAVVFSGVAFGLGSNYRTGTLVAGTAYNSIERTWFGNQITNTDTQNIGAARMWAYKSGYGYLWDGTFFLYGQSSFASCFDTSCTDQSNTRDWCQSSNTRSGSCTGHYR